MKLNGSDTYGTAIRYENPKGGRWFNKKLGRKIYIEPKALAYIEGLNNYDQHQLCKGIEELARIPSPINGLVNKQHPAFFKGKEVSSTVFNFLVKYSLTSEVIIISNVNLDRISLGKKDFEKDERQSLYSVKKVVPSAKLSSSSDFYDVKKLEEAWLYGRPQIRVGTKHAAVNGMLNNLVKASWLMGVHMEAAYPQDKIDEYTLFHNPTESGRKDFFESVQDNLGLTTPLAEHLAAILLDVQRRGEAVRWVAHSQGCIIFKQAVKCHLKRYPGQSLDKNSVVFHAGGHNKREADKLLKRAGIAKSVPDKDNPFDMVPNLAGRNNLSPSGIARSLQFAGKVMGDNDSSTAESPHTLPFISLEAYHGFLVLAKDYKSAEKVRQYMDKLTNK